MILMNTAKQQVRQILVWNWHREGMKINDGTGKGIRITPGGAWEREWEWGNRGRAWIEKTFPLISTLNSFEFTNS